MRLITFGTNQLQDHETSFNRRHYAVWVTQIDTNESFRRIRNFSIRNNIVDEIPSRKSSSAFIPTSTYVILTTGRRSRDVAPAVFPKLSRNIVTVSEELAGERFRRKQLFRANDRANSSVTCALARQIRRSNRICLDFFVTFFIKKKSK